MHSSQHSLLVKQVGEHEHTEDSMISYVQHQAVRLRRTFSSGNGAKTAKITVDSWSKFYHETTVLL